MAAFVKRLLHRCCPCRFESSGDVHPQTVNIVVGFFWLVNMQVGTGFLGIPFSFGHGGLIAGAAALVVIAFVCWITGIWILEVIARAQVYIIHKFSCWWVWGGGGGDQHITYTTELQYMFC